MECACNTSQTSAVHAIQLGAGHGTLCKQTMLTGTNLFSVVLCVGGRCQQPDRGQGEASGEDGADPRLDHPGHSHTQLFSQVLRANWGPTDYQSRNSEVRSEILLGKLDTDVKMSCYTAVSVMHAG